MKSRAKPSLIRGDDAKIMTDMEKGCGLIAELRRALVRGADAEGLAGCQMLSERRDVPLFV